MSARMEAAMSRLDEVLAAPVPARVPTQEHLAAKAAVVMADQGMFTAVISTQNVDREKDIVLPEAMVAALQAWGTNGKMVPLAWSHLTDPEEIVGHVDPASAKAVNGEVVVDGWVDRGTQRGRQVWRLVKSNTLGFSFGYLVTDSVKRTDGVREIRGLDVFEISATATPMNADTRVVSWKANEPKRTLPTSAELRELERGLGIEDPEIMRLRTEMRDAMLRALGSNIDTAGTDRQPKSLSPTELREKAERVEREHAPVLVASFEC